MNYFQRGQVWHERFMPKSHRFSYDLAMVEVDLLSPNPNLPFWYGHSWSPIQCPIQDYLHPFPADSWKSKLESALTHFGMHTPLIQAKLITLPRFLGYSFNPVSFFLLEDESHRAWVLIEVANTFGEKHPYLCPAQYHENSWQCAAQIPKNFYVSPFNTVEGYYQFQLIHQAQELLIQFDLYDATSQRTFVAGIQMSPVPFELGQLCRTLIKMPLTWLGTSVRILYHAFILFFMRKLSYIPKPHPGVNTWITDQGLWLQRVLTGSWLIQIQNKLSKNKLSKENHHEPRHNN